MADISDVENALVDVIAAALFPSTTPYLPGAIAQTTFGQAARVFRGWPLSDQLNRDFIAQIATVGVFPRPGMTRRTTRYPRIPVVFTSVACTLLVAIAVNVATFSGTPAAGQLAGVAANGVAYSYAVQATDTLASIATALAALVPGASATAASVTLPTTGPILGRTGVFQQTATEIRRQVQGFLLTCFCPSPSSRDLVASAVDLALAETDWIALPDGTAGRLLYDNTTVNDFKQKDHDWQRAFVVTVEYPTTQIQQAPPMLFGIGEIKDMAGNVTVSPFPI